MPTFRGENGNPGDFELCYGEVDDARAAVRWLASQKGIDTQRIYVLGDDNGGVIASLMSLYGDGPERFTASCSGIRRADDYVLARINIPFDRGNAEERALRTLIGHAGQMRKEHVAFYGDRDRPCVEGVRRLMPEIRRGGDKLTLIKLEGDAPSLAPYGPALFLKEIDAFERRNGSGPKARAPRDGVVS